MGISLHSVKEFTKWNSYGAFEDFRKELVYVLETDNIDILTPNSEDPMDSDYWRIKKEDLDDYLSSLGPEDVNLKNSFEFLLKDTKTDVYGYYHFAWY